MIKLVTILAADGVVVDKQTNNVTLYSIVEMLTAGSFPFFKPSMFLFFGFRRSTDDPQSFNWQLEILNNEDILLTEEQNSDFGDRLGNRTIVRFDGFVVPAPGWLKIRMMRQGEMMGEYDIEVVAVTPPKLEITTPAPGSAAQS